MVTLGAVSVGMITWILAKAILFLVGAILFGQITAPYFGKWLSKVHTGVGMKLTLAIVFALVFAYLAQLIGLAPIVGAFAAGLVLDPVHFRHFKGASIIFAIKDTLKGDNSDTKKKVNSIIEKHARKHIEDLIEPVAIFLVPIFFVTTGMAVNLETLFNIQILAVALAITVIAIIGKVLAGYVAGSGVNKAIIGWGMVPRGEVGLIFASIGKSLGVVPDNVFSIIVIVVILTTLITPVILTYLLKKNEMKVKS